MSDLESLRLDGLHERHPGLTQALGQSYVEAASVCLSRHHQPPVTVSLKHAGNDERRVVNLCRSRCKSPQCARKRDRRNRNRRIRSIARSRRGSCRSGRGSGGRKR